MQADRSSWYTVKTGNGPLLFDKDGRSVQRPMSEAAGLLLEALLGERPYASIGNDLLANLGVDTDTRSRPTSVPEPPVPLIDSFRIVLTEGCDYGCTYCFEADLHHKPRTMTEATLQLVLDKLVEVSRDRPISIQWFGGEPLLFFNRIRAAVEQLGERCSDGFPIKHVITTHGGLVNEEIAHFFRRHAFWVWVSMDGPEQVHDQARQTKGGAGTHAAASRALKLLLDTGVNVGVLVTAGPHNLT